MDIFPILKSMSRNKVGVGLLMLEIAVTTAIAINCFTMIQQMQKQMNRETGIDEANLITVRSRTFGTNYQELEFRKQTVAADLERLRNMPGVRDACVIAPFPLIGGGSSSTLRPIDAPPEKAVRAPLYFGDTHMLGTLGLELVAGRNLVESDLAHEFRPEPLNALVTQDLADALFPDGDALGKQVDSGDPENPNTIVGIVRHMQTPYDNGGPMETRIAFTPLPVTNPSGFTYMVRTEPGRIDEVIAALEDQMLAVESQRVISTRPLTEVKAGAYVMNRAISNILSMVVVMLGLVTAIGILGMTSFAVTRRTKQIGIRRALGATRRDILRYFLVENSLIAAIGILAGIVIGYLLNAQMIQHAGATRIETLNLLLCAIFVWFVGLVATAWPALRGARIAPAVASRTV